MDNPNIGSGHTICKLGSAGRRNVRSLDEIADDIHKLDRNNRFDRGDLLLEAQSKCEHGDFLIWLNNEFDCGHATAYRCIGAAKLAGKFPKLRNLRLRATTIDDLLDEDDEDLPAIIAEKH